MNKNTWIGLGISLLLVAAQLAYKKYQYANLHNETMQIHDEAMKNMAEMNRFGRKIGHELHIADSLHISGSRRDSLEKARLKMATAEDEMMKWMAGFDANTPLLPMKNELEYIRNQKSKIEKNAFDIREAIETGKNLAK